MDADSGPGSIRTGENTLRIASIILVAVVLIFYIDIITPLGLAVWILYFIPLFLTLYLEWRHGPFIVTGVIIILTAASLFLSPRDISLILALLNRIFFCLLLAASALLIGNYKKNEEKLRKSEEHYRILVEWSPDANVVYQDGAIIYANLAFLRLFTANGTDNPAGRDILDIILPADRQLVHERISQAAKGAQVQVPDMHLLRSDGSEIRADLSFREVIWDGSPAVLIIIRALATA